MSPDAALVVGIEIGVDEVDDERFGACRARRLNRRPRLLLVERRHHRARGVDPFRYLEASLARHDGLEAAEHAPRVGPCAPAELQRIAEALGGDERAAHPLALQHGVGADRGAVDDRLESIRRVSKCCEARHEPVRLIRRRRRHLGDAHGAGGLIHQQQVGEGAADIDPEPATRAWLAHGLPSAPAVRRGQAQALQGVAHQLQRHPQEAGGGFRGHEGCVGRQRHVLQRRQGMVPVDRLVGEDIETRCPNRAALQRLDQGRLVDDRAARGVDQHRAPPHEGEAARVDDAPGLVVEAEVERHHMGVCEQRIEGLGRRAGEIGRHAAPVPGNDVHADSRAETHHLAADAAGADHAERLAGELHAVERAPRAGAQRAVHPRGLAAAVEHQRQRVLGDRDVAIALDGAHLDAEPLRRRHVDVARRAGAHEDDHLEGAAGGKHLFRHVGVVVDDPDRIADVGRHVVARHVVDGHGEVGNNRSELVVVELGEEGRTVEEDRAHRLPPDWLWVADCSRRRRRRAGTFSAGHEPPSALREAATVRRRAPVLTSQRPTTMQARAAHTQRPSVSSKISSAQKMPAATTR